MANQLRSICSIAKGVAAAGIAFGVASAAGQTIVGAATADAPLSLAESPHWYPWMRRCQLLVARLVVSYGRLAGMNEEREDVALRELERRVHQELISQPKAGLARISA